jgi:hypothetical protein
LFLSPTFIFNNFVQTAIRIDGLFRSVNTI